MSNRRLPIISTSEVRTFNSCRRKHHLAYRIRIRPVVKARPLQLGTISHVGLEVWWKTVNLALAIDAMREHARRELEERGIDTDPFDLAMAVALMTGYDARWRAEPIEVLAVEAEFETDIIDPTTGAASLDYRLGGKIDAILRYSADGRVLICEHKTTSEDITGGSPYMRRLRIDSQISNYLVGARALGFAPEGCLWDVIRKPTLRPYKKTAEIKYRKDGEPCANQRLRDETPGEYEARLIEEITSNPEKYFARVEVIRLASEEEEASLDLWQTAGEMRGVERSRRYRRNSDACVMYRRACDYLPICSGEIDIDDPRFRVAEKAHEELETMEDEAA
ncbi:PD-(D/E)XK nuclease family protein [Pendulispora brunnea]|uniref:PD-(D/E)XK nuclease family protein n=1 Tax=Pendulispora brunnea TaxID=2905690 RepID=A0ABZ2KDS5_9BACT